VGIIFLKKEDKMKTSKILLAFLIAALLPIAGCWIPTGVEHGSGVIVKESRTVSGFDRFEFETSGNVYLSQGDKESIAIETDDNIINHVKTDIQNGVLNISTDKSISPKKFNVYLTMKNIYGCTLSGSGNINAQTQILTPKIDLQLEGSGSINLPNLLAKESGLLISGSGNITVKGNGDTKLVQIDGSGNIDAFEFESQVCKAVINGSGNAAVNAKTSLDAQINGSGDITYRGNPKVVKRHVSGSGSIRAES